MMVEQLKRKTNIDQLWKERGKRGKPKLKSQDFNIGSLTVCTVMEYPIEIILLIREAQVKEDSIY